jgi:hypothetical protein
MAHENNIQFRAKPVFLTTPASWHLEANGQLVLQYEEKKAKSRLDPWETRKKFISLKFSREAPGELLAFLNRVGVFAEMEGCQHPVNIAAAKEWQRYVEELIYNPSRLWEVVSLRFSPIKSRQLLVSNQFRMKFSAGDGIPEVQLIGKTALQAILATIHIDHAREAKIRICARPDCRSEFELTSEHKRIYCKKACAHFESVRRLRKRRREAAEFAARQLIKKNKQNKKT